MKHFYIARIYANYEAAVRTIEKVFEYRDQDRAELERGRLSRAGVAEHCSLIVTAGRNWEEAEQDLKARLGD